MLDSRGDRWFVSFDAAGHPEAATGAIAVANKIFWALGYWQVENSSRLDRPATSRDRRQGDLHAGVRAQAPDARRAISTRCCGARIAAPTAATAPSPPARSRPSGRRLPLPRHAPRRSERRRAARASARAARAQGVRRVDQPRRHEGRQHARRRGRSRTAAASCATTCRTSARRSAPAPTVRASTTKAGSCSTTATLLRKRLLTLGFFIAPWQTVDVRRTAVDRTVRGRCLRSAVAGSRASRRRRCVVRAPTIPSGPRAVSPRSPTT